MPCKCQRLGPRKAQHPIVSTRHPWHGACGLVRLHHAHDAINIHKLHCPQFPNCCCSSLILLVPLGQSHGSTTGAIYSSSSDSHCSSSPTPFAMVSKFLALTLTPVAAIVMHTNAGYNYGSSKCPCVAGFGLSDVFLLIVCVSSMFFCSAASEKVFECSKYDYVGMSHASVPHLPWAFPTSTFGFNHCSSHLCH